MKEFTREKGFYYGIRQYKKATDELIKTGKRLVDIIHTLLIVPCEVYIKDNIIYIIFDDDIGNTFFIANQLHIHESYINHISVLTGKPHHYAIPLDFFTEEIL